ncbi:SDR family oxidoreductase [Maricaulis sp.]|uniref:SDR family oxidoreductase n=1 Tax=Maricaulis sp. TaxID=1486257 RepID=UPI002B276838|nr:SDR family oxidoreductase [Maricaulis sp.]
MTRLAVVIGAGGGLGEALSAALLARGDHDRVIRLSRRTDPPVDFTDLASVERAASWLSRQAGDIRLVIDATGFLHDDRFSPERSLRDLDPEHMERAFLINAIGPAMLMKHVLPLLPRDGRCVFATLSARVGSISDNRLGGWHSYRASKAALNQLVRGAAIELGRRHRHAICVALHPGTVDTPLSRPFSKSGLEVRPPSKAAAEVLAVIEGLTEADSGGFFDHKGEPIAF